MTSNYKVLRIPTLPIIRLARSLVSARENPVECKIDKEKALQDCMESLMLQAAGHSQLNNFVEINLRPFCQMFTFFSCGSKLLFGDNLDKRIQDINAQSKIKSSLASNGQGKISCRSSGGRENSHHLHKREHYTKIFNSFPSHQKSTRLGEATTQKKVGFMKKKVTFLQVSIANGEFNISVHIQNFDQYVDGNIPNHFEQWVITTRDSVLCSTL